MNNASDWDDLDDDRRHKFKIGFDPRELNSHNKGIKKRRRNALEEHLASEIDLGSFDTHFYRIELGVVFIIGLFVGPAYFDLPWYWYIIISTAFSLTTFISKKALIVHWTAYNLIWAYIMALLTSLIRLVFGYETDEIDPFTLVTSGSTFLLLTYYKFKTWLSLNKSTTDVFTFYFPNL